MRRRVFGGRPTAVVWGLLAALLLESIAWAQAPIAPPGIRVRIVPRRVAAALTQAGDKDSVLDGVFLPPDRQLKRRVEIADELIAEERFGEAVRLIGSLLEGPEDFFYKPDPDQPTFSSLKAEAGRLLARLPAEGRSSYELQYGARARQLLEAGVAAGDMGVVADVSRRFFFTQAGAEATFLLGRHYLDLNRPQAAAMCFERVEQAPEAAKRLEPALSLSLVTCLLRSGRPEQALERLVEFRGSYDAGTVPIAGREVRLFAGKGQALAWMDKHLGKLPPTATAERDSWVMFRGDEQRNARTLGGQPLLSLRWRQRTCDDAAIEEFVGKLRHDYRSQDIVALPSMHPLAVDDVVVMRTAFSLQAVDIETGKLVWRYSAGDESLEQFLRAMASRQSGGATQQMLAGLDSRMWEDNTYGTLSSDGENVYYIEDLGLAGLNSGMVMTVLPNGQRRYSVNTRGTNRLAARELRTQGKLKWSIGGVTGEDEPQLAGCFFLGPPLALMGQLYAMAEFKGQEIRLLCLSPETGRLEWSQQLAIVDPPVTADNVRRNAGATPSYADGVLVCPTASGAIVGVDLSTRALLWGYQYPRQTNFAGARRFNVRSAIYAGGQQRAADHWADGSVTIAEGRALVTPVETDELFCLSLVDGRELWKQPRGMNLYVACVHDGRAIVVGHKTVSALNLADGTRAWPDVQLPDEAVPSGRGFYSDRYYHLPLTSAQVARIDLDKGEVVDVATSRSGDVPGNLICYRDTVISQDSNYVDAFYQLDALKQRIERTLADKPDDPQALAALGEIKLDEGALAEAVDLLRRAYEIDQDAGTRIQLVESLLTGLRSDFASYRGSLDELEQLVEQPRHQVELLRLKAGGLQQAGEVWPAFETYVRLLDMQYLWELDEVDANLSVRRDRWLARQLVRLRESADAETGARMDEVVRTRFDAARQAGTTEALRSFVNVFGDQPAAEQVRLLLAQSLSEGDLLEQDLLLQSDVTSSDAAVAGPAIARMAEMMAAAGQTDAAAAFYRELNGKFAEVTCLEGRTGSELVEALPADSPLRRMLETVPWPTGRVKGKAQQHSGRSRVVRRQRTASLELVGKSGPLWKNVSLSLALDAQQHLIAEDSLGHERFRILLSEQGMRRINAARNAYTIPSINYASAYGGLVVLSLGTQIMAIDTLRAGDTLANRVLWVEDLSDQIGGLSSMQSVVPRPVTLKWGGTRYVPEDGYGRRYGTIGPVTERGVYFQRLHDLYCVDPLSGKTLWVRRNVPLGLDLFGDDEYLLATPANKAAETLVLRASTGELVGSRPTVPIEERMTTIGRKMLTWRSLGGRQRMEMRDLVTEEVLWSYEFASGSKASIAGHDVIGVFQPDGAFSMIRLADGERFVEQQLKKENMLIGIHLLPWQGGYLMATHAAAPANSNRTVQPYPNSPDCPLLTGRIYAFDRETGQPQWKAPVSVAQHGLLLSQPADLPVLVLMRQMTRPSPISSREPRLSVMCIDKRSGEVVYHDDDLRGTTVSSCLISGDPTKGEVTIALANQEIKLTYSEDGASAEPSRQEREAAARALLESLGFRHPVVDKITEKPAE